MKVERLEAEAEQCRRQLDDLLRLRQGQTSTERPCAGCDLLCQAHQSLHCACSCSADCPEAPARLSSDPERFPIEQHIVPLVYALASTRECTPCWSCEGHEDKDGMLTRVPRVVFDSRSDVPPTLITEYLGTLFSRKNLNCRWDVLVSPFGNVLNMTYTIEPRIEEEAKAKLYLLRHDAKVIAEGLAKVCERYAATLISELGNIQHLSIG